MKKNFIILILFILGCWNLPLKAETNSLTSQSGQIKKKIIRSNRGVYSLASLVDHVLTQNELIHASNARIEEKRFILEQSRALSNPEASLSIGHKRVGSTDGSLYEATLSQSFLFPGKLRLRSLIASKDVELSSLSKFETELSLIVFSVRLAYEYEINRKKKKFAEERLHRFELVKEYLQGNIFASPQKKVERRIVEARLRDIDAERIEIDAALKTSLEKLKLYFQIQEQEPMIEIPLLQGKRLLDGSLWKDRARTQNFELAALRILIDKARGEKDLAAKNVWPDFESSLFYGQETAGETERTAGLGISIPFPIFNRNKGSIQSLEKKIEADNKLLRFKERELITQVRMYSIEAELSRLLVQKYPLSVSTELNKSLTEAESEFRKGRVDLLIFLELDSETAHTYCRSLEAQKSLADNLAHLFALSGQKDIVQQLQQF